MTIPQHVADNIAEAQAATKARIEALDQVGSTAESKSGWMTLFIRALGKLATERAGEKMIGEEIRNALLASGFDHPVHANAWGAAITAGVRRRMIVETGAYRKMKSKESHARRSPEYMLQSPDIWKAT